jgi:hypothetical protein
MDKIPSLVDDFSHAVERLREVLAEPKKRHHA